LRSPLSPSVHPRANHGTFTFPGGAGAVWNNFQAASSTLHGLATAGDLRTSHDYADKCRTLSVKAVWSTHTRGSNPRGSGHARESFGLRTASTVLGRPLWRPPSSSEAVPGPGTRVLCSPGVRGATGLSGVARLVWTGCWVAGRMGLDPALLEWMGLGSRPMDLALTRLGTRTSRIRLIEEIKSEFCRKIPPRSSSDSVDHEWG
jgi:hypothetical protein